MLIRGKIKPALNKWSIIMKGEKENQNLSKMWSSTNTSNHTSQVASYTCSRALVPLEIASGPHACTTMAGCIALHEKHARVPRACFTINWIVFSIERDTNTYGIYKHLICPQEKTSDLEQALLPVYSHHLRYLKDVRAKNFYNTDFFHSLATVR